MKKPRKKFFNCAFCEKEFFILLSQRKHAKYCSQNCYLTARKLSEQSPIYFLLHKYFRKKNVLIILVICEIIFFIVSLIFSYIYK